MSDEQYEALEEARALSSGALWTAFSAERRYNWKNGTRFLSAAHRWYIDDKPERAAVRMAWVRLLLGNALCEFVGLLAPKRVVRWIRLRRIKAQIIAEDARFDEVMRY